jgi:hypothetical protein
MSLPSGKSPEQDQNSFGRVKARVLFIFLGLVLAAGVFLPIHGANAAFPTTGILDNFNRADENPLANGNWTCPALLGASDLQLYGNAVAAFANNSSNDCYWSSASYGPDSEAYVKIIALPNAGSCNAVFARASNLNSSSFQTYWAEYCPVSGASNDTFTLYRFLNNTSVSIANGIQEVSAGDSIGLEVIGTRVRMLYKPSAGAWTQILSVTDSNISGSGRIGLHSEENGLTTLDDFSGGTVALGVQVSSRSDTLSDSRPSATSNHTVAFTVNNAIYGSSLSGSSTVNLTLPSGFSIPVGMDCGDVDAATSVQFSFNYPGCASTATAWGFSATGSGITLVPPSGTGVYVPTSTQVTIKIGSNATVGQQGAHWITNPSTGGVYTISVGGTFGGSGNMLVSINAGVSVQATVAESLSLSVSSIGALSCTADDGATITAIGTAPTSVPFGTVSLNTFYQGCQDLVVSTNAGNGYSVTVQESSAMRTVDGRFSIPDTTCDGGACTESAAAAWTNATKNGLGHTCFNQLNHDCNAAYSSGVNFRQAANLAAGETAQSVMSSSTAATATGRVKYRLSAGVAQPAGIYTTVISYTIYATY